jgi:hypothetical protein
MKLSILLIINVLILGVGCTQKTSQLNRVINISRLSYRQGCLENFGKDCERKSKEYETKLRSALNH